MIEPTYRSPAGTLIEKRLAPTCGLCGKPLWNPIYPGAWPTHNGAGERYGYVVTHREVDGSPCCWNGKACRKRRATAQADSQRVIEFANNMGRY